MTHIISSIRKATFFATRFLEYAFIPRWVYRRQLQHYLTHLTDDQQKHVKERVAYYNKLAGPATIINDIAVGDYRFPYKKKRRFTFYVFDIYEVIRYFDSKLRFCYIVGDVTHVPSCPTFVKSRPIGEHNSNSVILKLNKRRHYGMMVNKDKPFSEKKDMLVSRTTWANASPQRRTFCHLFWNHPLCDVGKTKVEKNDDMPQCVKPFLSVKEQLEYKFIACVEGVDVATNLKWVMSSNSVAVSPPMRYETWFMEGRLIPNYHYIEVKPDFSDLIEKLEYYISHPEEAEVIIRHAHEWVAQFLDKHLERVIQLSVAQKYFHLTNP